MTLKLKTGIAGFVLAIVVTLMSDTAAAQVPPSGTAAPMTIQLIEYYNRWLDHYFLTGDSAEVAALDSGIPAGWVRTGAEFTVFAPGASTGSPVCRFYGLPAAGLNSHFYSGDTQECLALAQRFPMRWIEESANVFQVRMPERVSGTCPGTSAPVYRLFNNRADVNHRYTTDEGIRQSMISRGYVSEGYGPSGVAFCSEPDETAATGLSIRMVITPTGADAYDFTSMALPSQGSSIVSQEWSFGDGTGSVGRMASHRYTTSGTYPVVLTVRDSSPAVAVARTDVAADVSTTPPNSGSAADDAFPMAGPSNVPDVLELEMIDQATLDRVIQPINIAQPFANDPQFLTDASGLRYLRFSSFDGATRLISWFLKFPARDSAHARYCIYVEDDVADGMTELGVKLPGLASTAIGETLSWRMEHGPIQPGRRGDYALLDYRYDAESGGGFGAIHSMNATLHAGRWYVIEQRAKLNTPGQSDGEAVVWLNGHEVYRSTTTRFRNVATTLLDEVHVNVYHGGSRPPSRPIHYRIAKIAVSSSYIGVPGELLAAAANNPPTAASVTPQWRARLEKGVIATLPNTASLNGVALQGNGNTMGSNVINAWNGLAAGPTTWWAAANGGHDAGNGNGWENKVFTIDLAADAPRWTLVHPGSPRTAVTATAHYADGLPASRHSYYSAQFIASRNRVMQFGVAAPYSIGFPAPAFQGGPIVDGFNIETSRWDPAGTYPDAPFMWTAIAVAKHPTTDDVYIAARGQFAKWTQATNRWATITPAGMNGAYSSYEFHPSLIDARRNRWVHLGRVGPLLHFIDLTTTRYTNLAITGPLTTVLEYTPLVHDLDNDRYVTVQGSTMYAIDPRTGVSSVLATVPAAVNGVQNRLAYFQALGGIAYLPQFSSNILFLPTR
jgi:hypothetical protein